MRTLSGFVRDRLQRQYDGPIPSHEQRFVEQLLAVEGELDESLSETERAVKRLTRNFASLLQESAFLEASRQIFDESGDIKSRQTYENRRARVMAQSRALASSNAALQALLDGNHRLA